MIITISGDIGSGKSTVAKMVSERLGLKYYCIGEMQRDIAKEKDLTLQELQKLEEKDDSLDKMIEEKQKKLGKDDDDFVIDSRLGWYCIPNSIKIFLAVDIDEAARRIFEEDRKDEEYADIEEAKKEIIRRKESEKKRYKTYYNIDHFDLTNYDLIIDTTNLTPNEVVDKIVEFSKNFSKV